MRKLLIQVTCILLMIAGAALWAQTAGGRFTGKVTAADGSPVANAAVTVTSQDSGTTQRVLTGPDGSFTIVGLPVGTYKVEVESAGYKRTSTENVSITATGPNTFAIALETGNINETVQIKAVAPMTQTSNAEIGIGFDTPAVLDTPNIDRNHQQMVTFQTGITPPVAALPFSTDPDRNRFYSTNGQFPYLNQYFLDGLYNTEPYRNTAVRVAPDLVVRQFNVATANLVPSSGFTGGAFANSNTIAANNSVHGDLFEYWSGNILRSRSFFDPVNNGAPRFVYNQFGATIGAPIVKDKLFIMGNYQGQFSRGDNTQLSTVPDPSVLGGNFSAVPGLTLFNPFTGSSNGVGRSAFTGNVIPSGMINPTSAAIASFIPAPNAPGLVNNFVSNTPFQWDSQKADGRLDLLATDKTMANAYFGFTNARTLENSPLGTVIGSATEGRLLAYNSDIGIHHIFGDSLIGEARLAYTRYDNRMRSLSDQFPLANSLGLSDLGPSGLVGISIPGMPFIGATPDIPQNPVDNIFNPQTNWSYQKGANSFKFGADIRVIRADRWISNPFNQFGSNGTAYFGPGSTLLNNGAQLSPLSEFYNSFAGFLMGAPSQVGVVNNLVAPNIRQQQYAPWVEDTIHIFHHLTVSLGLRYELYSPLSPSNTGRAAYFDPTTNTFNFAGVGGTPFNATNWQKHDFAPRIGLAYSLNDRTVIRAGYGIQYFQMPYSLSGFTAPITGSVAGVQGTYDLAPLNGPFGPTVSSTTPPPSILANGAFAGNLPGMVISRNLPTPYVQTFSFQIQRDLTRGILFSAGYVGMLNRHLPGIFNLNAAAPGTGAAGQPLAALGNNSPVWFFQNGLTSNYNSLQVSFNKRFSQGLAFMAGYTYSKSLGYTNALGQILNPFGNLHSNYGPMDFDRTHMLHIMHLWEIPFGRHGNSLVASLLGAWQLNGSFNWQTGVPLTFTADPLLCNCPGNTVLAGGTGPLATGNWGQGTSFFNNSAFFAPVGSNIANLGRGVVRSPDTWTYDLSLFKNFPIFDRFNLQIRGDAYNLTNTTIPTAPNTNINAAGFGIMENLNANNQAIPGAFGRMLKVGATVNF